MQNIKLLNNNKKSKINLIIIYIFYKERHQKSFILTQDLNKNLKIFKKYLMSIGKALIIKQVMNN